MAGKFLTYTHFIPVLHQGHARAHATACLSRTRVRTRCRTPPYRTRVRTRPRARALSVKYGFEYLTSAQLTFRVESITE